LLSFSQAHHISKDTKAASGTSHPAARDSISV
jgi:hypothetical protein